MSAPLEKAIFVNFDEIEPGMRYNLYGKIVKVNGIHKVKRVDAEPIYFAFCVIGDETACANILLKGSQVEFAKEGKELILRNVKTKTITEHIRLEVDIWGKIENGKTEIKSVNTEKYISHVEYAVVPANE